MIIRADSKLAVSQWETLLQSNAVSHWLGANLESALIIIPWMDLSVPSLVQGDSLPGTWIHIVEIRWSYDHLHCMIEFSYFQHWNWEFGRVTAMFFKRDIEDRLQCLCENQGSHPADLVISVYMLIFKRAPDISSALRCYRYWSRAISSPLPRLHCPQNLPDCQLYTLFIMPGIFCQILRRAFEKWIVRWYDACWMVSIDAVWFLRYRIFVSQ